MGVELDTAHFTGNQVPRISIEISDLSDEELTNVAYKLPGAFERVLHGGRQGSGQNPEEVRQALQVCDELQWKELLPKTPLRPGFEPTRMHYFTLHAPVVGTTIRVNSYPDGGVARLRLWGQEYPPKTQPKRSLYMPIETGDICTVVQHSSTDTPPSRLPFDFKELSSQDHGGLGLICSNKHFGEPWRLTQSNLGKDMGDGWETARHPDRPSIFVKDPSTGLIDSPLKDWSIIKLGQPAENGVARVILDTKHFRGNYPESVLVEGCYQPSSSEDQSKFDHPELFEWFTLIPRTRMAPDSEHVFDRSKNQVHNATLPVTHVRITIFPDGGLSRVRIYG